MLRRKAERVWTDLAWCEDEDSAIKEDMDDVEEEKRSVTKTKKHHQKKVELLKDLRWEMKRRIAEVENELDTMTEEDIEHGEFDREMNWGIRVGERKCEGGGEGVADSCSK